MRKINAALLIIILISFTLSSCKSGKNGVLNGSIVTLTSDNFSSETADGVVMVDFWASWCRPCRAMAPVIDAIAAEHKGKIKVGKVDVDANGDLANQFHVQGIPNILIFKEGKMVENLVGMQSKETLVQALSKYVQL